MPGEEQTEALKRYLSSLEENLGSLDKQLERKITPAAIRAHVTTIIIWLFAGVIAFTAIALIYAPSVQDVRLNMLLELIKTALLPIVTFVIGHYFGSKTD